MYGCGLFLYVLCSGISEKLQVIDFNQLTGIQEFYLDDTVLSYVISVLRGGLRRNSWDLVVP